MVAQLLRNIKLNINQRNYEGLNSFWIACSQGFSKIMVLLAAKKIDLLNVSEHGMNVLHLAVNKNYPDIIRLLLVNYSFPLNQQTN
jgi:ankyrin repeat protein